MKTEDEIREQIKLYEEWAKNEVSGSPEWRRHRGRISALQWVLRDK